MRAAIRALVALASLVIASAAHAACPAGAGTSACIPFPAYTNAAPGVTTPTATDRIPYVQSATTHYVPPTGTSLRSFGAACDGTTDDTAPINAALASSGNGPLIIPAGATCNVAGTLLLPVSGVRLLGGNQTSQILCSGSGTSSCIQVGAIGSGQVADIDIGGFLLNVPNRTGGEAIDIFNAAYTLIHDIYSPSAWHGIWWQQTNNAKATHNQFQSIRGTAHTDYCLQYYTPNLANRSDVLTVEDTFCTQNYLSSGFIWDGPDYTVTLRQAGFLHVYHGLWIRNTAVSNQFFPQELSAEHMQVDGASANACEIDAGFNFTITANSVCSNTTGAPGQGNADGPALVINADNGASITRAIRLIGMRAEDSQQQAAYINGQNITVVGSYFTDASQAGAGNFPAVEIGPNCGNCTIADSQMGPIFGNPVDTSYGVQVDAGSAGVILANDNFNNNLSAPGWNDLTNGGARVIGGLDNTGAPIGPSLIALGTGGDNKNLQVFNPSAGGIPTPGGCSGGGGPPAAATSLSVSMNVPCAFVQLSAGSGSTPVAALNAGLAYTGGLILGAAAGNLLLQNGPALATNATQGYVNIQGSVGPPTGVPVNTSNNAPACVIDTVTPALWCYITGAWKQADFH